MGLCENFVDFGQFLPRCVKILGRICGELPDKCTTTLSELLGEVAQRPQGVWVNYWKLSWRRVAGKAMQSLCRRPDHSHWLLAHIGTHPKGDPGINSEEFWKNQIKKENCNPAKFLARVIGFLGILGEALLGRRKHLVKNRLFPPGKLQEICWSSFGKLCRDLQEVCRFLLNRETNIRKLCGAVLGKCMRTPAECQENVAQRFLLLGSIPGGAGGS